MDCNEYIERYLNADADGELTPDEARLAAEHLQKCVKCRAELADIRALKDLLCSSVTITPTPADVRARIAAILDSEDAIEGTRGAGGKATSLARRPSLWIATAIAAALLAFVIARPTSRHFSPEFAQIESAYSNMERNFVPTLTARSAAEMLSNVAQRTNMRVMVWDFTPAGFRLVGSRIDHLPDGRDIVYTMYQGDRGTLMCARFKDPSLKFPGGGRMVNEMHHLYRYKGISMCVTMDGDVACFLVTRMAAAEMKAVMEKIEGGDS